MSRRLRDFPNRLVAPGDAVALAGALVSTLGRGAVDYGPQPGWAVSGAQLEAAMRRMGQHNRQVVESRHTPATRGGRLPGGV